MGLGESAGTGPRAMQWPQGVLVLGAGLVMASRTW